MTIPSCPAGCLPGAVWLGYNGYVDLTFWECLVCSTEFSSRGDWAQLELAEDHDLVVNEVYVNHGESPMALGPRSSTADAARESLPEVDQAKER